MDNPLLELFWEYSLVNLYDALARSEESSTQTSPAQESSAPVNQESGPSSSSFADIIKQASEKYGINEQVISAVIRQESSFNPHAVSSCGAQGLMQLMPSTARSLGVDNAFNPQENIMAGTRYLKQKLDEFGGNLALALAAYNAGSGAVRRYGGIPPYKETQAYVSRIMNSVNHTA